MSHHHLNPVRFCLVKKAKPIYNYDIGCEKSKGFATLLETASEYRPRDLLRGLSLRRVLGSLHFRGSRRLQNGLRLAQCDLHRIFMTPVILHLQGGPARVENGEMHSYQGSKSTS